jgi:hypothetical protein
MSVAGFNEAIWHFLGYLHIADALARPDKLLDGAATKTITIDLIAGVPPPARPNLDVDDLSSRSIGIQTETLQEKAGEAVKLSHGIEDLPDLLASMRASGLSAPLIPRGLAAGAGGSANSGSPRVISVEYDDNAQQTIDSILQLNRMIDNDVATSDQIRIWDGKEWSADFQSANTHNTLKEMIGQAEAEIPSDTAIPANGDTSDVVSFVEARDHNWQNSHTDLSHQIAPGRYVDGVLSDETPESAAAAPEIAGRPNAEWVTDDGGTSRTISGPSDGIGTVAYTGGNEATNAAVIRDLSGLNASIIIEGDAFLSNAIFQVNILVDNDNVDLVASGSDALISSLLRSAEASGNTTHNIAEFVTHDYSTVLRGAAFTPEWKVDVVDGDFFSIRALTQINFLTDNDCLSQSTESTFFQLRTGDNQQVNLADIYGFDRYDIVIIGGDCHRANWIFQKNIVLDNDWITSFLHSAEDGEQTISTGRNSLTNEAHISTYGNGDYSEISGSQRDLIAALDRQEASLAPNPEWHLAGSATGTLKVLYITGDYYDLNLISQTNVICDVDQLAQLAAGNDAVVQGAVTGANIALNYAHIIDAGTLSGSAFLGGEAYEDSMLIQANIVTDQNQIVIQDASSYVPELIAFTDDFNAGDQQPSSSNQVKTCDPSLYDNLGQVMV